MRRDFDYVDFSDYQSDMKETADQAAAVIKILTKRADEAERVIRALVLAAGGRIAVPSNALHELPSVAFSVEKNQSDDTVVFRARVRA